MEREAVGEEESSGGSVAEEEGLRLSAHQRDYPSENGTHLAWQLQ